MIHLIDLFISCGELSGDVAGHYLLSDYLKAHPQIKACGVIGPQLESLGIKAMRDLEGLQVMGFSAVLRSLPTIWRHYRTVCNWVQELNPKAVLCIDYPGFHLPLAKRLRKQGYRGKIIQYICPTFWAWKKGRAKTLESYFDQVWGVLPFEANIFEKIQIDYRYVGNPSLDIAQKTIVSSPESKAIGLFPGSRPSEIKLHLPQLLSIAKQLQASLGPQQWKISIASEKVCQLIEPTVAACGLKNVSFISPQSRWQQMPELKMALAVSGTVCLELALQKVPTIALYDCGFINYIIAKYLAKIDLKSFTLPNIILRTSEFPEFIGHPLNTGAVYEMAHSWLAKEGLESMHAQIQKLIKHMQHYQPSTPNDCIEPLLQKWLA